MFTYISIEEFADGVVKNNKDANRRELIAAPWESLAAKKNGARCMICGAPIWAAGSAITGTNKTKRCCLTKRQPLPENNILSYWTASDGGFCFIICLTEEIKFRSGE